MAAILVAEDDPGIDLRSLTDVFETELYAMVRCEQTGSLALRALETAGFNLAMAALAPIQNAALALLASTRHDCTDQSLIAFRAAAARILP